MPSRTLARLVPPALLLLVALAALPAAAWAHGAFLLANGRWWDGEAFRERPMYSVEGVLRERWEGAVDGTLDLAGGFVVPPLGDAHNHAGTDPELDRQGRRLLAAGIFYLGNPNSIAELTAAARPRVNGAETIEVLYSLGGLTSPGGHPVQIYDRIAPHMGWEPERMRGQAYWEIADAADLARQWPQILAGKPDFLKVYLERSEEHAQRAGDPGARGRYGLDPRLLPEIVRRAGEADLRVLAHVASAADFRAAVAAGVDQVAHLPLERITAEDAERATRAGVAVVTTLVSHRPTTGFTDPAGAMTETLRLLHAAGATLLAGTDSHLDVVDELLALEATGALDRLALLRMAWEATPRWLYPGRPIGRLADGHEASFVVLRRDPTRELAALRDVAQRVKRGHLLRVEAETGEAPAPSHHDR